jgi:Integral membrane protein CcmA involved in cell shape determination
MWSERKQENNLSRRPLAFDNQATAPLQATSPAYSGLAVIGKAMVIRGQITSKEDMHVDGEIDGTLDMPNCRLTVGPSGKVGAGARAREVEVLGSIDGDVEASRKITIRKGGRLVGDLRTPGIVIEDGAYFKGKIEIVTTEAPAPQQNALQPENKGTTPAAGAQPLATANAIKP